MDLTYVTILVLASMIFVLAGMIGYLYWQQTRIIQHVQSLSIIVSSLVAPPPPPSSMESAEEEPVVEAEAETEQTVDAPVIPSALVDEDEEDDRVSVEHIAGPPATATTEEPMDVDDLQSKTKAQLQKMLTDKGIPYAKSDNKTQLIELLKATA